MDPAAIETREYIELCDEVLGAPWWDETSKLYSEGIIMSYGPKEDRDTKLESLILALASRFGRLPTDDEVLGFINGDQETREKIWNKGEDANASS